MNLLQAPYCVVKIKSLFEMKSVRDFSKLYYCFIFQVDKLTESEKERKEEEQSQENQPLVYGKLLKTWNVKLEEAASFKHIII